jgi:hypothetical protein
MRLLLLAFVLAGCGSLKKDMQTMCDAPTRASVPADVNPADKGTLLAQWIDEHLSSDDGRAFFKSVAAIDPIDRVSIIRAEAAKQGITTCAWADWYATELERVKKKPAD